MSKWFDKAFGTVGTIVSEARHELIDRGWFGRNFSPAPGQRSQERAEPSPGDRDIHGNERGIDR